MRTNLDIVEKRRRAIALNPKHAPKVRLTALRALDHPSDSFLCKLLKACDDPKLELAALETLSAVRKEAFNQKLLKSNQGKK
ncbi:MAG TPA: hypothetical protein VFA74_09230 [Terriglobales bacterium]|nr:hypothetical protein [Terriglobales bacterium]